MEVTVTEVSPPDKYELNPEPQTVTVTAGDQVNVAKLSFKNDKKPSELEIFKFEKGSNKPLGGAIFEISYVDPSIPVQPWEVVIPEDGYYRVTLEWEGAIRIVEKQAPTGYVIGSQDTYVATLYAGEKTTVPISNDKKGELVVIKRDAQDPSIRLKGATFKAELINPTNPDPDPEMSVKYATSDESGCAYFYDMLPGGWRITEEDSPQYYNKDPKVETVIIKDGSNETLTLYFDNEPWRGLRIRKVDYTDPGKGLPGATFSLYEGTVTERGRFVNTYTTGENGFAVVTEPLKTGINYTAFEEAAPYGYTLSEPNHLTFILHPEETDKTIIFHNKPRPKLLIRKIDQETGAPIPNTTFRIAEEGGKHTFDVTTGQDGTVLVEVTDKVSPNPEDHKFLNETWYEVWEISSAEGYLLSDEIHRVELRAGETTTIVASNYKAPSLTLRKVDKISGRGIPGVVLRLTYDGKDEYQDVTTGENGYVFLEKLSPGIVWVQEIKADNEYVLDDTRHSIELNPGGRHEYVITNSRKPSLTIIKKDAQSLVGVAGVTYRITRDGGTEYEDVTTGPDGKIVLKNQNPGLVIIEEISCPPSYILDPTPSYITLLPDGEHVLEPIQNLLSSNAIKARTIIWQLV